MFEFYYSHIPNSSEIVSKDKFLFIGYHDNKMRPFHVAHCFGLMDGVKISKRVLLRSDSVCESFHLYALFVSLNTFMKRESNA